MTISTLKKATEDLGISSDDIVNYYIIENKGIIEINLTAKNKDIEQSAVHDVSVDYLTKDELDYYLNLEDK